MKEWSVPYRNNRKSEYFNAAVYNKVKCEITIQYFNNFIYRKL